MVHENAPCRGRSPFADGRVVFLEHRTVLSPQAKIQFDCFIFWRLRLFRFRKFVRRQTVLFRTRVFMRGLCGACRMRLVGRSSFGNATGSQPRRLRKRSSLPECLGEGRKRSLCAVEAVATLTEDPKGTGTLGARVEGACW